MRLAHCTETSLVGWAFGFENRKSAIEANAKGEGDGKVSPDEM
jgi:hypothetical protein